MVIKWSGIIGFEDQMTGDGRLINSNALRWSEGPIPLRDVSQDVGAHAGAQDVGTILTIERRSGGEIFATGELDTDSPAGFEAARQIFKGQRAGISMDLDDVSFEIRVAAELLEDLSEDAYDESAEVIREEDSEGRVTVAKIASDDEIMVTTDARIRAATLVSIPAFDQARITLDNPEDFEALTAPVGDGALVASGTADLPPIGWFMDPNLPEPTALTVTEEGRVYGHLALWDTCHIAYTDECRSAPRSHTGYAHFRTGAVLTDDGEVAVGTLTMDTLHAPHDARPSATIRHYEHTGMAAAYVAVGEDQFGIWMAGTIAPNMTPADIRRFRASPISGDWRRVGGNLELVAALAVNVPGFPIPRPSGLVAAGTLQSLVASGMVAPTRVPAPGGPHSLSTDDLRYLKRLAAAEKAREGDRAEKARGLRQRVAATEVQTLAGRVRDALASLPDPKDC